MSVAGPGRAAPNSISTGLYFFFVCSTSFNGNNKIILQSLLAHNIPFSVRGYLYLLLGGGGGGGFIHSHSSHRQIYNFLTRGGGVGSSPGIFFLKFGHESGELQP